MSCLPVTTTCGFNSSFVFWTYRYRPPFCKCCNIITVLVSLPAHKTYSSITQTDTQSILTPPPPLHTHTNIICIHIPRFYQTWYIHSTHTHTHAITNLFTQKCHVQECQGSAACSLNLSFVFVINSPNIQ